MPPPADGRFSFLVEPLRNRNVRAIWGSLLASSLGDWAARLALAILVLDRTSSALLSALVLTVTFLPWVGPGQVLATRVGHLRRVPVMVTSDLVRAGVFAVLLLRLPVAAVLALAFVAALATPAFETARSSLTVEVVPEEGYGRAIALLDITDQSAIVLGYLVGGAVVAIGGYRVGLAVDIASYLISAALLARVLEERVATGREGTAAQMRRGARAVWDDRVIRRALGVIAVAGLGVASVEATAAAFARIVLHAGASTAGQLAAAVPLGVIAAIPFVPKSGPPTLLLRAAGVAQIIGGTLAVVAFGSGHLVGALIGFFGAGLLTGSVTPAQVAFQPRVPRDQRPAIFGVAQGLAVGMQGVGATVGGVLAATIGPRPSAILWMAVVAWLGFLTVLLPAFAEDAGPRSGEPTEPGVADRPPREAGRTDPDEADGRDGPGRG